ncbi:MAG: hypothetical protein ACK55N_05260, partial [Planctomycetota bacterium]
LTDSLVKRKSLATWGLDTWFDMQALPAKMNWRGGSVQTAKTRQRGEQLAQPGARQGIPKKGIQDGGTKIGDPKRDLRGVQRMKNPSRK